MSEQFTEPMDSYEGSVSANPIPSWPKWIGVFAVIWGALGLTCTGFGVIGTAFQGQLIEPILEGAPMPEALTPNGGDWALLAIGLGLTLVLLIGGILCIVRNPLCRVMILSWGLTSIPLSLLSYSIQMGKQASLLEWAQAYPNNQYAEQINMTSGGVGQIIGLVLVVVFGIIVPGFFVVWFGFIKTKPEQMVGCKEEIV